jgi:hypothetical protein
MKQLKLAAEFSADVARETEGNESIASPREMEIRALGDLEMVLVAGGGDAVVCW